MDPVCHHGDPWMVTLSHDSRWWGKKINKRRVEISVHEIYEWPSHLIDIQNVNKRTTLRPARISSALRYVSLAPFFKNSHGMRNVTYRHFWRRTAATLWQEVIRSGAQFLKAFFSLVTRTSVERGSFSPSVPSYHHYSTWTKGSHDENPQEYSTATCCHFDGAGPTDGPKNFFSPP